MAWIKQKPEAETASATQSAPKAQQAAPKAPTAPRRETDQEKIVNIGQSIEIKGELTGNEDLTIEGTVDGKILVRDHRVTIGSNARITAEVHAKTVVVIGQVIGNITADDKIEIAPSGCVKGDLKAPRVAIGDGATFKGSIEMGQQPQSSPKPQGNVSSVSHASQGDPARTVTTVKA